MKNLLKQLFSFILPVTVLVIVPLYIENEFSVRFTFFTVVGMLLISLGLFVMILTISSFIRIGEGTLAPWSPTKKLVAGGMYGYIRNPMISGVLTVLLGESIIFLSINILIWSIIFFFINNFYFILYEEPNLEKRFGDEYKEYKRNVPRWIPRFKWYKLKVKWKFLPVFSKNYSFWTTYR